MRWLSDVFSKLPSRVRRRLRMGNLAEPRELSEDEFREVLEARVQRTLNMSLAEFVAALRDGRLDPESSRVAGLAILVGERTG